MLCLEIVEYVGDDFSFWYIENVTHLCMLFYTLVPNVNMFCVSIILAVHAIGDVVSMDGE